MPTAPLPQLARDERGRFAPSPTGALHLGNARTALLAWLWSRSARGGFTLRVEDLDRPRVRAGLAEQQLEELGWLGLDWDEGPAPEDGFRDRGPRGPYRQSQRTALYQAALDRLRAAGHVYPCFCSRVEIAAAASAPHGPEGDGLRYPGTCASLSQAQAAERGRTRPPALRLRVAPGIVSFQDAIAGPQSADVQAQTGDFVLRRADGVFAYQLAVVVDDAAMGVTQVLRGGDLLPSTARQILLYGLLGATPPRFAHAPLVLSKGPLGEAARLAKRDAALSLSALRAAGADPRRVIGLLAQLSGLLPEPTAQGVVDEPTLASAPACTPAALVPMFAVEKVPAAPVLVRENYESA
ncbi:MAG: tRNA glutamyl-Q(34) synthetase GluQRS [Myxococcales bacterium]